MINISCPQNVCNRTNEVGIRALGANVVECYRRNERSQCRVGQHRQGRGVVTERLIGEKTENEAGKEMRLILWSQCGRVFEREGKKPR